MEAARPAQMPEPVVGNGRWLRVAALTALGIGLLAAALIVVNRAFPSPWTETERAAIQRLWIGRLQALQTDPTNRFADDARAAKLGARLFRDTRLSGSGHLACASCHKPELGFTDGLAVAQGEGKGARSTPTVVGVAHGRSFAWDGRRDSQWAQALIPLERSVEMAGTRSAIASLVSRHYREEYEAIFGPLPALSPGTLSSRATPLGTPEARAAWEKLLPAEKDAVNRVFANTGKALAAYQRTLSFGASRFDRYASHVVRGSRLFAALSLTSDEVAGLQLFIGKARCVLCHDGPLFTGYEFFALGLDFGSAGPDRGRGGAFAELRKDPFNCLGRYSDARPEQCAELRFLADDELGFLANFKTPSLRNAAETAPYMHAGQLDTLERVVDHYDRAPSVPFPEHTDIQPLNLSASERSALVAFLRTLTSPIHDPLAPERD